MTLTELVKTLCDDQAAFMQYAEQRPAADSTTLQRFYWYGEREKVVSEVFKKAVYKLIPDADEMHYRRTVGPTIYSNIGAKATEERIKTFEAILSGEKFPRADGENLNLQQQDYLLYFGIIYFVENIKNTAVEVVFSYQHNVYLIAPKMEELFEQPLQQRSVRCLSSLQDRMIERIKEVKGWQ